MTPEQCRAARALLDWTQQELASRAKVGLSTLRNFERGASSLIENNLAAVRTALEKGGAILADDGSSGVALRRKKK